MFSLARHRQMADGVPCRNQRKTIMSKHDEKLEQKSPAKPVIKKGSGALDDKDLEKVNGGVTLNYEKIEVNYTKRQ
jgi:hypothetical protein